MVYLYGMLMPVFYIFSFVIGAIIGSFLNVVILRYNTGRSPLKGHSFCFFCSKPLAWWELVPVLSFLVLKGRCFSCRGKISFQYIVVELLTAGLFTLVAWRIGMPESLLEVFALLAAWTTVSLLLVISLYDLRHHIIPDSFAYAFAFFGLLTTLFLSYDSTTLGNSILLSLAAGFVYFLPFYLLWKLSEGQWMGLGDGKLAIGIGTLLGFSGALSALLFAFWIATLFSLALLFSQRLRPRRFFSLWHNRSTLTMKSEIPFGPFLALATMIVFLFQIDAIESIGSLLSVFPFF